MWSREEENVLVEQGRKGVIIVRSRKGIMVKRERLGNVAWEEEYHGSREEKKRFSIS